MTPQGFRARRVVTCDPGKGTLEDAVVVVEEGRIAYVGPAAGAPSVDVLDVGDRVVTPGLVDAHTHACWLGSRHAEYAVRMAGGDYRDIAKAGGGILSTHRAVAAATEDALAAALVARLRRMAELGVTTVEVKSGYGLEPEHELKQLAAIARAAASAAVPAVVPTFLALHALPPSADRAAYVAHVARELVPRVAREGLARFVDAYVDANAFTVEEARTVGEAARAHGLGVRLHVGQFADVGGADLAAELGAASVDHVEHISPAGVASLARAGVAAVLLPVASFTLAQPPPPVAALREAGVPLVVASDANPGTAPTESLPLALALAVRAYGLSPDEGLLAATRNAALSLGLSDRGVLREGARADVVVWDLPHEHALVQPWGGRRTHRVLVAGVEVAGPA
ncbi:MAG TPA: imidazolonepropionase [Polyangiaceae bacterium]|jgi:imidazolonepropionase